jgi:hypothetical protein
VVPAGKYSVWSAEGLQVTFGAGGQQTVAGSLWQWEEASSGGMGVAAHLFSQCQCIVAQKSLPRARGSGCQNENSPYWEPPSLNGWLDC